MENVYACPLASIQHQARSMTLAGSPDLIRVFLDAGMLNSILLLNRQEGWISQIFLLSMPFP
jgi:hypothetical protein